MKFVRISLVLLIGLAFLHITQTPPPPAEAVTNTVLLSTLNSSQWGYYILCPACYYDHAAAGFSTPATPNYTVNQVEVWLLADAVGYSATLSLWNESGGVPGALISTIGTATIPPSPTYGHYHVVFDTNLVLAASTSYYLVVEGLSGYGGWDFMLVDPPVGPLTLGGGLVDGLTTDWLAIGNPLAFEMRNIASDTLTSNASCNGTNLSLNITDGDGPYNITGTGLGLPTTRPAEGTVSLSGPGVWSNVAVTEIGGDGETVNLGTFSCTTNLAAVAVCVGDNLNLNILAGDGPFTIGASLAPSLPATTVGLGTVTLPGPGTWTNLTVTESGGDLETAVIGTITCSTTLLNVLPTCAGDNLLLNLVGGDGPFNITGIGPGLPLDGVGLGTITLLGPAVWSNITVTETTGNLQSFTLTSVGCKNYGIPVPNLGLVMITGEQFQPAYSKPNGAVARGSDGAEIWLPADADGNWYDTYVIAEVIEVDGEIWLGLFVGNVNWAYVRLADVTVIVPIQGVE